MPSFPLPHLDKHRRETDQARALAKAILETNHPVHLPVKPGPDATDARRLRGIPVVGGRGAIGGHINGSRPDTLPFER